MPYRSSLSQDGNSDPRAEDRRSMMLGALAFVILAATVALMVWLIVSVIGWLLAEPLGL